MPPKFSLQNVLEFRHHKVEVIEVELGKLMAEQMNFEKLEASLHELQDDLMSQFANAMSDDVDMFNVTVIHNNIVQVGEHISQVENNLANLVCQIEGKRDELVKAKQEEETLEILKQKRLESFNEEQAILEARFVDDIYIARAFRQQQEI